MSVVLWDSRKMRLEILRVSCQLFRDLYCIENQEQRDQIIEDSSGKPRLISYEIAYHRLSGIIDTSSKIKRKE